MSGKRDSLVANIEILKASVFFVQESRYSKKGRFKLNNFEIFETVRQSGGGSILTGVHCDLNPVLISDGAHDSIEVLVVEGDFEQKKCRFINGYGPQEAADADIRINFFARIEEEIINAKLQGALICIQLDANAKLGSDIIKGDPHQRSSNGELLLGTVTRNNLIVCNSTALCTGVITRTRSTVNGDEESVIDFMIVCEELFALMTEMRVDEEKNYAVESCVKVGNHIRVTKTDHNMMIGRFNLKALKRAMNSRREIFKYDDTEGQKRFKELTSENKLSKCFEDEDILKASDKWLKEFKNILHRSFKKVRVGNIKQVKNEMVEKMKDKHRLKNDLKTLEVELKNGSEKVTSENIKKKHNLEDKIELIEIELANATAEKHATMITEHFKNLSGDDGDLHKIRKHPWPY